MADLLSRIDAAEVPIGVWVGPTGARLYGAPAQILAVADVTGMAPGARVGNVGAPISEFELGDALTQLKSRTVGLADARALDLPAITRFVLGEVLERLSRSDRPLPFVRMVRGSHVVEHQD